MAIKPDHWIRRMAEEHAMLEPFEPAQIRGPVISYGLSSYGYDIRLADEFKRPHDADGPIDPKSLDPGAFDSVTATSYDLPAHTFVLGRTIEYFRIPSNVLTICVGKSSYARCGVVINVTPFEPGWEGFATLCIANVGPRPVRLHAGEGIAQVLFFESDEACDLTYDDRQGKYQAQTEITTARLG